MLRVGLQNYVESFLYSLWFPCSFSIKFSYERFFDTRYVSGHQQRRNLPVLSKVI